MEKKNESELNAGNQLGLEKRINEWKEEYLTYCENYNVQLRKADEAGASIEEKGRIMLAYAQKERDSEHDFYREMIIDGPGCFKDLLIKEHDPLLCPLALVLWDKLYKAGLMDKYHQPCKNVSYTKCALIASLMAVKLNLTSFWELFDELWGKHHYATLLCHIKYCDYYSDLFNMLVDLFELKKSEIPMF